VPAQDPVHEVRGQRLTLEQLHEGTGHGEEMHDCQGNYKGGGVPWLHK